MWLRATCLATSSMVFTMSNQISLHTIHNFMDFFNFWRELQKRKVTNTRNDDSKAYENYWWWQVWIWCGYRLLWLWIRVKHVLYSICTLSIQKKQKRINSKLSQKAFPCWFSQAWLHNDHGTKLVFRFAFGFGWNRMGERIWFGFWPAMWIGHIAFSTW